MKYAVCRQIGGEADTTYLLDQKAKRCVVTVPPMQQKMLVISVHSREYLARSRARNERMRTCPGAYDYGSTRRGTFFFVVPIEVARKGDVLPMPQVFKTAA